MEAYENRGPLRLWAEGLAGELATLRRLRHPRARTRFCIFGQGRSGSTLMTTLLNSHPEIRCEDELLRRPRLRAPGYLDCASRGPEPAFGFHLKPYHLTRFQRIDDLGGFLRGLSAAGWRIVHLVRRDVIAHAFSSDYAHHHGWHRRNGGDGPEPGSIAVDPAAFVRRVRKRQDWRAREMAALAGLDPFTVVYEDHLSLPEAREMRLGELQSWLGVGRHGLVSPLRKSVRGSPWESMRNPDEVRAALCAEGLEHLLPEREQRKAAP